ncbi:MAG: aminotransferase class I/II-fold pyridoxal phosphate-dependent enzyme, partial [Amphiplicatus sp.]
AYCPAPIADVLNRIRGPFNVTSSALAAGEAALGDQDFVAKNRAHNRAERERMAQQLGGLGLDFTPSVANFILVKLGSRARNVQEKLRAGGVIVREMEAYGLGDWLRVSIGTEEANSRFIDLLTEIVGA